MTIMAKNSAVLFVLYTIECHGHQDRDHIIKFKDGFVVVYLLSDDNMVVILWTF